MDARFCSDHCRRLAHDVKADALEADYAKTLIDAAHVYGWMVAHFRPAQTAKGWRTPVAGDGKGYPDLTLVHAGRRELIFAELKLDGKHPTVEQERWLESLGAVSDGACLVHSPRLVQTYLWHLPSDLERALAILAAGNAKAAA